MYNSVRLGKWKSFNLFFSHTTDGQISWVFNDSLVQVKHTQSREFLTSWRYVLNPGDDQGTIACISDINYRRSHLLLIALESNSDEGILGIFDVTQKRIVRAIEVPQKVILYLY